MNADFRIGDTVICVAAGHLDDKPGTVPSLRLNMEYIIHDIRQCPICDRIKLDVGLALPNDHPVRCLCGARAFQQNNTHWCESIRFIKKSDKSSSKELDKQLTKALLNEDYELAAIIRDKILQQKNNEHT